MVKYLEGISDTDIPKLELPTAILLIYERDERLEPLTRYYLGNSSVTTQAQDALDHLVEGDS
jgi:2,3-bisphosphoglycerate-dependent phosphoglycerate mutase